MPPLHDPLAVWFARMRAHGELPDILIGRSTDGRSIEWRSYPHEYYDAVGAVIDLMRRTGYDMSALPGMSKHSLARTSARISVRGEASAAQRVKNWLRTFTQKIDIALEDRPPWRDFDDAAPTTRTPPAVMAFSREQTDRIHDACRRLRASMNSLLLCALDRSIDPLLIDPWAPRYWVVPVNMRGRVHVPRDTGNHSSGVYIRTKPGYSPSDIQDAVREQLRLGVHVAQWTKQRTISKLGGHVVDRLMRQRFRRPQYATAAMSYGGNWSPPRVDKAPVDEREQWFPSGTPGRMCAILAGSMEWYGRLSLTLGIHSAIAQAQTRAEETMRRWGEELLKM